MTGTIRNRNEADQAVDDLQAEFWMRARNSSKGGQESLEDIIEQQGKVLRELARSSGLARAFIEQRVETMRRKRKGPELANEAP